MSGAVFPPYRVAGESPLFVRERAIEAQLAGTRLELDAYANEELRVERRVRLGEAPEQELFAVRATIAFLVCTEARLASELEAVRAEMVARGERRVVRPHDDATDLVPVMGVGIAVLVGLVCLAMSLHL